MCGILLGTALLALAPASARDKPVAAPGTVSISVSEPSGFSNLVEDQRAVVDIYFGNRRLGEAEIIFKPGSLRFVDPQKLIALLPDLESEAPVKAALSAPDLPTHANLVCSIGSDVKRCGRLSPTVAGIIFDQQKFRVDLFINSNMLAVHEAVQQKYLPKPESGVSLVNGINAVMSGSGNDSPSYNFQDRFILGNAERRLRGEISYASGFGVQADSLIVERDKPGWRYSGGAFWTPGMDLIGRRKMVGLGIETQIDTRLDKDALRGNPLVVFLGQRSRVNILRDGRVLATRIYEPGNQSLDTSNLPDGSYEVVLRIEEAAGGKREERRFFTKNPRIAAAGEQILFAYAGVIADDTKHNFLSPTRTPFFQAGAAQRLGPHLALDGTVMANNRTAVAEIGGYYIGSAIQLRLAALGSSRGGYGGLAQIRSQGNSRLTLNADLRHIKASENQPIIDETQTFSEQDDFHSINMADPTSLKIADHSFSQVSGNLGYSLPSAQFSLAAVYRRERSRRTSYRIGPSVRWDFLHRGPLRVSLNGDAVRTERGNSGFLGLSLQLLGQHSSIGSTAGMRTTSSEGEPDRSSFVGGVAGSWQHNDIAGAEVNIGGSLERDTNRNVVTANADVRGKMAAFGGQVAQGVGRGASPTQYSLGFQTSVAVTGDMIAFDGKHQSDSMIVVKVNGLDDDSEFQVIINNRPAGTVRAGTKLAVALTPYRQYDVRIRPIGTSLVHYDGSVRRVGLYPGNVAQLDWTAQMATAMFGQIVFENGRPVEYASISAPGAIGATNKDGYFQIETTEKSVLQVKLADGRLCRIPLPSVASGNAYAPLGTLTCSPSRPDIHLTSVSPPHSNQ
ncbi:MAG: TcfC E-set like domain-containing protein [Sphingomonadaceae bacterium]|nr:TcfC E-set like domain-containing protein [Sphingomonadaceae bacterium]